MNPNPLIFVFISRIHHRPMVPADEDNISLEKPPLVINMGFLWRILTTLCLGDLARWHLIAVQIFKDKVVSAFAVW